MNLGYLSLELFNGLVTGSFYALLSLGLAIGLARPEDAERLLRLIEAEDASRLELEEDAAAFCEEVLS